MSDSPTPSPEQLPDPASSSTASSAEPAPAADAGGDPGGAAQARHRRGGRSRGRSAASGAGREGQEGGGAPRARPSAPRQQARAEGGERRPRVHPLMATLAQRYPALFGDEPLPLKRGVFQDLVARHGDELPAEDLKAALGLHTRSTRYLSAVAAGQARHDLDGQAVESMAPEHVHHALLEVFKRRQQRSQEDLAPKLRRRLVQAFEASGLSREDYALLVRHKDESVNQLLDEALAEAAGAAARDEALLRAFEASGQTVAEFADAYGRDPRQVQRTVDQAARRRQARV